MLKLTENQTTDAAIPVTRFVYKAETGAFIEAKPSVKFIKGPIPFDWLRSANALPGKAGQVGIALWFLSGVKQSKIVKVTSEAETLAGCVRQTFAKGLSELEGAGLISVTRNPGQKPTVEILQTPSQDNQNIHNASTPERCNFA